MKKAKNISPQGNNYGLLRKAALGRVLVLKICLLVFFAIVVLRLVQIQVVESPKYQEIARKQYEAKVPLPAARGNIFERNGKILVSNSTFVSFAADPKVVRGDVALVADRFSRVFGKSREEYRSKLTTPQRRFVWLERLVNPATSSKIRAADFEGVVQLDEPKRLYHYDHVAGQILGFTGIDNNGLSGIELQCDELLSGTNGYVVMQRDGLGRRRPSVDYPRVEPSNGKSLVLTIDLELQAIAEEELRKGIERNKSSAGLVVMMDPRTGELLAMALYPILNPNRYSVADTTAMKNRIITDMFEPGSVFKLVTESAALENNLVKLEEKFFAENGDYLVTLPGGKQRHITDTHPAGWLTFREAVEHSSNIVFAKLSDRIGAERLFTMARNYGFGTATGTDLPGEVRGDLKKPTEWSGTTLNTLAYGYEVGATPIQIASAYAALANKGILMKPFVIKQVVDEHQNVVAETQPQVIRRVVSKETAEVITSLFEGVVERGTGEGAKVEGLRIAGKTGTSRKVVNGKYNIGSYTASFAGFFPAEDPKVVCLVMLDNPREGGYTGGLASAPIFRAIAEKIIAMSGRFNKNPEQFAGRQPVVIPDVANLNVDVAKDILEAHGFDVEISGNGKTVLGQTPVAGTKALDETSIRLATDHPGAKVPEGFAIVPDVRGLTMRRAINRLTIQKLDAEVRGSGIVSTQAPPPGRMVKAGMRISITCSPKGNALVSLR